MKNIEFSLIPFADSENVNTSPPQVYIDGKISVMDTHIDVHYCLNGNRQSIKYAKPKLQGDRQENLWETTCFELFIKEKDKSNYWEYNLSPSSDWNVFCFSGYRQNKSNETDIKQIQINVSDNEMGLLDLNATLPLPARLQGKKHSIGISCVLETIDDVIYFFALTHNNSQPDFHDSNSFIIST